MLAWTFTERSLTWKGGFRSARTLLRHLAGVLGVLGFFQEDGELVPAKPRRGVAGPQRPHEASGHGHQQLVAGGMAQGCR